MSFIIRHLSRTADGREIVRASAVAAEHIAIGRRSENAVHLADLAVAPVHATVTIQAPGRIEIASVSGLGFGLDGRTVLRAELDPAAGAELRFGSHRLRLGAEADAITIAVERVEALSDASAAKDQQTVFTVRGLLPGKRISAYGFVALVLAAFLAWPVWTWASHRDDRIRPAGVHGDASWSSGALSAGHAGLKDDCQACHVDAFVAVRDQACIACHAESHQGEQTGLAQAALTGPGAAGPHAYAHAPADRMAASRAPPGLGARVQGVFKAAFNHPDGRCVDCHTEHEGAGPMPATAQAFCADCHAGLEARLRQAGFQSAIGDATDFGVKHPQFRPLVLAGFDPARSAGRPRGAGAGGDAPAGWRLQRVALDRPVKQAGGLKFTHRQHLSDRNGVAQMWRRLNPGEAAGMDCADCHRTDNSGTRYLPVDMERDCQSCHSLGIETVGGTVRQLPHGQPEQVIADIRAFYSAGGGYRPAGPPVAQYARQRPGDAAYQRRVVQLRQALEARPGQADALVRATFSERGVCGECHAVRAEGPDRFAIAPVAQPGRYLHKGWFDHSAHVNLAVRVPGGGSRSYGCADCHAAAASNDADDLLLPGLANCQSCHTGPTGATTARLIRTGTPSGCAMCHDYHADGGAPWVAAKRRPKASPPATLALRWK